MAAPDVDRRAERDVARTAGSPDVRHATQRHQVILRKLRSEGQLRALDVAHELGVTHETVRKDLLQLEGRGLLTRVHGGALPVETLSYEPSVTARTTLAPEKRRIAAAAADLVPAEGAILIDAGSTTAALAENFPMTAKLTVVTNALPVALTLMAYPNLSVHTVGGRVRPTTMAEVDHWALRALGEVRVDVAFLGANAFSVEHGLSTPDDSEAAVKRAMVTAARRTVLMADHTKLGRVAVFKYAEISAIDVLVTDKGMAMKDVRALQAVGVEVIRA
jgi:DeoR family transcriptional regulator, fructose operon transcriptional repressor